MYFFETGLCGVLSIFKAIKQILKNILFHQITSFKVKESEHERKMGLGSDYRIPRRGCHLFYQLQVLLDIN